MSSFYIKKLNTNEDYFNIHKLLGGIVLINYIYRFGLLFIKNDMNLENNIGIGLLGIHGLLSLTSLIFKLSNKRNKILPIIYPEFRLHNILFAFRSILCCLSFYFTSNKLNAKIINYFICFYVMFTADIITYIYKSSENNTTMRSMPTNIKYDENKKNKIKELHSSLQLYATYYMIGNINTSFSPMFAIQIASLLMTLVKKNIIKIMWWHYLYTISLWFNMFLILTYMPSFIFTMNIGCYFIYYWRFKFNYSKYIGWLIVFIFDYYATQYFENNIDIYVTNIKLYKYSTIIFMLCFYLYKFKIIYIN